MTRRSVVWCVLLLTGLATLAGAMWGRNQPPVHSPPALKIDSSVASDLQALATETWGAFLTTFEARSDCFGDVRLHASLSLPERATYDPATATVTVRVPATAALLREAMVHEWAHHLDFQCDALDSLRPAFLAAQGFPPGTPWRPAHPAGDAPPGEWASIPAEQFAEATIEAVLGSRQVKTGARLTRQAVRVVADWAAGDDSP